MGRATHLFSLAAVAVFGILVAAPTAHARRGVVLYHYGESYYEAGAIPPPFDQEPALTNHVAGFQCSAFGLFWATFATWDCKPVAMDENSYVDEGDAPELMAAIGKAYDMGDTDRGFWEKHGRWPLGLVVLVLLGAAVLRQTGDDDDE